MRTIKIAGAGIAGLTAAVILAKNGYSVKVFEKNEDVGKRFNDDFQGLMNWGFKEDMLDYMKRIGLGIGFWNKPVRSITVFGPDSYQTEVRSESPLFYLVRRGLSDHSLDKYLKKQALRNGAEIIFNKPVNYQEVDIVATGLIKRGAPLMALGYVFESDADDISVAIFSDEVSFRGYSYCFIVNGQGVIATANAGDFSKMANYLEETRNFLKRKFNFNINNEKKFSGLVNFYLPNNDKKFIGEAGGFQDFLFGFGIRYAMISAELAAQSIQDSKNFKELYKKELSGLIKTSISNRFLYSVFHRIYCKYSVRYIGSSTVPRRLLTKLYNPNIVSKIIYPLARLYLINSIKSIKF